jgi:XTP/dITP diphosphohydrolase
MNLLVATLNPGKVREFREMLGGAAGGGGAADAGGGAAGVSFSDLSAHPGTAAVEETGHTFRANACLKASVYARMFDTYAVADDSGLEVDALNGSPGVYSARWAEMNQAGHGDGDNNALLLRQLADTPDEKRTARFVCVLALADPSGKTLLTTRDTVEGRVLRAPRGQNGFGYDPLFLIDALGKTTAELSPDEKHAISHRGKALRRLRALMSEVGI